MKKSFFCSPRYVAFVLALTLGIGLLIPSAAPAAPEKDYTKMRGYVDFESMKIFGDMEATVEVYLKGALLAIAREAVGEEDPELRDLLSKIELIRVQVFELEDRFSDQVIEKTKALAKQLDKKGWEIAVRVRERDEHVYVYLLPGKNDDIDGMVVMAIEDDDEAVFVNIVGKIDPTQLGRIGRFCIGSDSIDIPMEIQIDDDEEDDDDEGKKAEKKDRRVHRR
ncbi:MAG: DUF4252 domain-containing protein [Candidatus Latescibacterota bacterium]|nr:MAG: DUF4252 domain-containing protein [Candidatus Latescibacterota bacterium]